MASSSHDPPPEEGGALAANPELSVVISSFGNPEGLRRVLEGYAAQEPSLEGFEALVVVDAADPDPAAAEAAIANRRYPVRMLRGAIPGLSANRNAGWRGARAPLVLFTDNDTIPKPQLVAEHRRWHERHPEQEVGVLGHVRWAREVRVTPFMHWLDHGMQFAFPFIEGIEAGWGHFYGANVSVKRELCERVGGFDEERLPYGYEDLDFGYRASKLGMRLLYNRDAVVEHLREFDLEFYKQRMRRLARAELEFVRKHPEIEPYFFRMFSHRVKLARVSGRGRHLIRWVPRGFGRVGKRAWRSADLFYRQELAPAFLAAWEEALSESATAGAVAPLVSELEAARHCGPDPGGPK
jgi:GT2 family glycosyltransferase